MARGSFWGGVVDGVNSAISLDQRQQQLAMQQQGVDMAQARADREAEEYDKKVALEKELGDLTAKSVAAEEQAKTSQASVDSLTKEAMANNPEFKDTPEQRKATAADWGIALSPSKAVRDYNLQLGVVDAYRKAGQHQVADAYLDKATSRAAVGALSAFKSGNYGDFEDLMNLYPNGVQYQNIRQDDKDPKKVIVSIDGTDTRVEKDEIAKSIYAKIDPRLSAQLDIADNRNETNKALNDIRSDIQRSRIESNERAKTDAIAARLALAAEGRGGGGRDGGGGKRGAGSKGSAADGPEGFVPTDPTKQAAWFKRLLGDENSPIQLPPGPDGKPIPGLDPQAFKFNWMNTASSLDAANRGNFESEGELAQVTDKIVRSQYQPSKDVDISFHPSQKNGELYLKANVSGKEYLMSSKPLTDTEITSLLVKKGEPQEKIDLVLASRDMHRAESQMDSLAKLPKTNPQAFRQHIAQLAEENGFSTAEEAVQYYKDVEVKLAVDAAEKARTRFYNLRGDGKLDAKDILSAALRASEKPQSKDSGASLISSPQQWGAEVKEKIRLPKFRTLEEVRQAELDRLRATQKQSR